MQTIWKYKVEPDMVIQSYQMPKDAIVLSFGLDPKGDLSIWVKIEESAPLEEHLIACVGTGWPIDNICAATGRYACFVGSAVCGPYVWHLFDLGGAGACLMSDESAPQGAQE